MLASACACTCVWLQASEIHNVSFQTARPFVHRRASILGISPVKLAREVETEWIRNFKKAVHYMIFKIDITLNVYYILICSK